MLQQNFGMGEKPGNVLETKYPTFGWQVGEKNRYPSIV
jgi:hypothetical protein